MGTELENVIADTMEEGERIPNVRPRRPECPVHEEEYMSFGPDAFESFWQDLEYLAHVVNDQPNAKQQESIKYFLSRWERDPDSLKDFPRYAVRRLLSVWLASLAVVDEVRESRRKQRRDQLRELADGKLKEANKEDMEGDRVKPIWRQYYEMTEAERNEQVAWEERHLARDALRERAVAWQRCSAEEKKAYVELRNLARLASATGCPKDTLVIPWLVEKGLLVWRGDGAKFYAYSDQAAQALRTFNREPS